MLSPFQVMYRIKNNEEWTQWLPVDAFTYTGTARTYTFSGLPSDGFAFLIENDYNSPSVVDNCGVFVVFWSGNNNVGRKTILSGANDIQSMSFNNNVLTITLNSTESRIMKLFIISKGYTN